MQNILYVLFTCFNILVCFPFCLQQQLQTFNQIYETMVAYLRQSTLFDTVEHEALISDEVIEQIGNFSTVVMEE